MHKFYIGDAREVLKELHEPVHLVIASPPLNNATVKKLAANSCNKMAENAMEGY